MIFQFIRAIQFPPWSELGSALHLVSLEMSGGCPRQAAERRQELGLAFGETITAWAGWTLGNTHRWINQLNRVWNTCPVVQKWNLLIYCVCLCFKNSSLFDLCCIVPKGSGMVCHILCKNSSLLVWHLSLGTWGWGRLSLKTVALWWQCSDY